MSKAQIVALIVAAYLLTDHDKAALITLLVAASLDAMQRAYQRGQRTVGATPDWTPTKQDKAHAQAAAERDVQSIADTYTSELTNAAEAVVGAWLSTHDSLDGALPTVTKAMGVWSDERAGWKSKQVANFTAGRGNYAGTSALVVDMERGFVIDTETGEAVEIGDYAAAVLPPESSKDECSEWAGNSYDLSDFDTIPAFPMHGSCPHEVVILQI